MRGIHWFCLLIGFGAGIVFGPMVMGMFRGKAG
jgi:hypothetical protein